MLRKEGWVATLLDTLLGVQDYKKVKFPGRDISSVPDHALGKSPSTLYHSLDYLWPPFSMLINENNNVLSFPYNEVV